MSDYLNKMAASFEDELVKISKCKIKTAKLPSYALPVAAGALGFAGLQRIERDRRLGRQMRTQQQQGY